MSTATMKTLQRAGLAAVALFAVAGFAVDASAATVRGEQTYVPADQAATAPGTLPATRAWGVQQRKDASLATASSAQANRDVTTARNSTVAN